MRFSVLLVAFTSILYGVSNAETTSLNKAAIFVYPTAIPTANVVDTIKVSYITLWTKTNLTVFCLPAGGGNYNWWNVPDNPCIPCVGFIRVPITDNFIVDPTGIYPIPSIGAPFENGKT